MNIDISQLERRVGRVEDFVVANLRTAVVAVVHPVGEPVPLAFVSKVVRSETGEFPGNLERHALDV
jgi:hypothetical protein